MWPPTADEFRAWLELARDMAATDLRFWLRRFPILVPASPGLIERSVRKAARTAVRRWRLGTRLPDYVEGRIPFAYWFCGAARQACLRRVLLVPDVRDCLRGLAAEHRRILLWLYIDQWSVASAARVLRQTTAPVRLASHQAYDALRNQIAHRLGEDRDAFPPPSAAVGEWL